MSLTTESPADAELWAQWNLLYRRTIQAYILGLVRRHDLADDLTQEVFCRAWQARDRYQEQGTARAYLLRIADRLVVDHYRQSGREVNLTEEGWKQVEPAQRAKTPEDVMAQEEVSRQLASTLDNLSLTQRRVLLLRYYGEIPFTEIAAIMGCPLSTALSHCHRGLLTLRKLLGPAQK